MSLKKYKKIGVTTQGYRGERLVLEERVIEGFIQPEFETAEYRLSEDSEQTIYLTNDNVQNGYYLILPNAVELWNNWRTTIINNSSHTISIYYYSPEGTTPVNLNLIKEIVAGNMTTLILLDNTTEQGTWTTLRTSETVSADTTEKYVSNVYDKFDISYTQLQEASTYFAYKPETGSNLYTIDNPIRLDSILYNSSLQPVNPQPSFTINDQNWILENLVNTDCINESADIYRGGAFKGLTLSTTPQLGTANSWEIKIKYTYNGGGNFPTIFGSSSSSNNFIPTLYAQNNNLFINLSSTGTNWDIASSFNLGLAMTQDTTYYFKLSYTNTSGYSLFYSTTDFETGTTRLINSTVNNIYCNEPLQFLNVANGEVYYSGGTIHLANTSITIDSTTTNFGYLSLPSITTHTGSGESTIDTIYTYSEDDNIRPTLSDTIINLSKITTAGTIRSIYIKPTEQFLGSAALTVSIGTENNPNLFYNQLDITGEVSNTNFNKDLFEEILSTSSDVQLIATFEGTNINTLTSGNLQVVVERTKLIDPTILKNAIVTTQVPTGAIFNYAFDDTPVGYVRLDGTIIPDAVNTIPQFVEYLNKVNNRLVSEKLIVTPDVWEQIYNQNGSCGKFAWYNSGLRFPAVRCFIKGLSSISQLSKLTEAGLPNITGDATVQPGMNNSNRSGAFYTSANNVRCDSGSSNSWSFANLAFDASRSNSIYGNSNTVTPINIQYPYIISVANKVQASSQIDYDKLVASSINKADVDLSNVLNISDNFKYSINELINTWTQVDYNSGISSTLPYISPKNGTIHIAPRDIRGGYIYVNDVQVVYIYDDAGGLNGQTIIFKVNKNDTITASWGSQNIQFFPYKGAN